jgi:hypothetical protein
MEPQVIEFIVENTLPEDSLVGLILQPLWGTLELVKYPHGDRWDLQQNERIKYMHINIMVFKYGSSIKMGFEILSIILYSDTTGTIADCFQSLLAGCLNRVEEKYQEHYNGILPDIRQYPVFQLLESFVIFGRNYNHCITTWMNVKVRFSAYKRINLEVDDVEIGNYSYSEVESLMKQMIKRTLPDEFYSGLPIQRIKSARNK